MHYQRKQSGFTLIEILTAIVVFSIGLIGLGFLMTSAVRSNHVGFQHTQASFVAESILDRMRANMIGVWNNSYNGTYSAATATPGNLCGAASTCDSAAVATRDTWAWGQLIGQMLPAGSGTVACVRPAPPANIQTVPVYNGTCTITISWIERSEGNDAAGVPAQFQWVVQP